MELLSTMARGGHDRVLAVSDADSGLRAWIALHHLGRGPAYGGIRVWSYRTESDALADALRLSKAMTYKCILAGVQGGGGKTVVLADPLVDRPAAMERLGREIEALGGAYQTGPDAGFTEEDRVALARGTGNLAHFHGCGQMRSAGEATAEGAEWGIRAALAHLGVEDLSQVTLAIQGLGSVGGALARRFVSAGARVLGADISEAACEAAEADGVELFSPSQLFEEECDVLAPCALGGTVHDLSISRMRTKIVAGVANNVLGHPQQAELLRARDILFLPDFVLNAGALIEGAGNGQTGKEDWSKELQA
ncbi:MAG: Glu/Leu/Phe/Val dehydrogenase dimerization domain-containing protein, partial [Planctomycetota bacterium]